MGGLKLRRLIAAILAAQPGSPPLNQLFIEFWQKQHPEPIRASLTRFNTLSHLRMGIVEAVFPIRKPALGTPHQGLALVVPFALC